MSRYISSVIGLIIICFCSTFIFGQSQGSFSINRSPLPEPTAPVNDYAGVLDPATKSNLDARLIDLMQRTGIELGVAVVKTTGDRPIFEYSLAVARGWGIGSEESDNPGALLFVAIDDRKYFTQISKDLEDELPDGIAGSLQRQYLVPEFKKGNYSKGISDTIDAYIKRIDSVRDGTVQTQPVQKKSKRDEGIPESAYTIFLCVIVIFIIFLFLSSRRGGGGRSNDDNDRWGGGGFGGGGGGALPWVIGSIINSASSSSSSSSWGDSSDWGGGSDWGGFGGGGDFGGGGAGGDW